MTGTDAHSEPRRLDRRRRRHLESRDEILDEALAVMEQDGAASLNLTEVARRVGLQQSSLYQYFESKAAVYDALFERGMRMHLEAVRDAADRSVPGLEALRAAMAATVRFSVDNPVLAQLLFLRVVPGFTPSDHAYAPSVEVAAVMQQLLDDAVAQGALSPDASSESGHGLLVALAAGIASLQIANEPGADFDSGRFAPLIEPGFAMFVRYFTQ